MPPVALPPPWPVLTARVSYRPLPRRQSRPPPTASPYRCDRPAVPARPHQISQLKRKLRTDEKQTRCGCHHLRRWTRRPGAGDRVGVARHHRSGYGGYGINTSFEDARNLGWKFTARLKGWSGHKLLDSYDAERWPVFWSTANAKGAQDF